MTNTIEVARRGQITIPKNLRDTMGISEGQQYRLRVLEGGILVLTPYRGEAVQALDQLRKQLIDRGASLEEMLGELRRLREADGE